jgi:hypothetical protein
MREKTYNKKSHLVDEGCSQEYVDDLWVRLGYDLYPGKGNLIPSDLYDFAKIKAINEGMLIEKPSNISVNIPVYIDINQVEKLGKYRSLRFRQYFDLYLPENFTYKREKTRRMNISLTISKDQCNKLELLSEKLTNGNLSAMVEAIIRESK